MDCKITSSNRSPSGRLGISTNASPAGRASQRSSWRRQRGMTMVETLIALGISAMVLAQVCALWFYSTRSFAAQASYAALDQDSQRALDWLSRDVRQATNLVSFSTNAISFKNLAGQTVTFQKSGRQLLRITPTARNTLLKDCDWLSFKMFQRTPISGSYDQYPTTDMLTCKLIEVNWKCSRRPYPTSGEQTEFMQSARIVLRSK
jgi:prepilin-type N-terminal cleavage/methylation domain-containing protein